MFPSERRRVIAQFMSCKVCGPEWILPPAPKVTNSKPMKKRAVLNPDFGKTFVTKGKR